MKLSISTKISSVKSDFHALYPGLKLEFYNSSHDRQSGSKAEDEIRDDVELGSLGFNGEEVKLNLDPQQRVCDFEEQFKDLNLNIQVFRRSNYLWLQTTKTDKWSLFEQNRKGLRSTEFSSQ